jgi:hypothetical protein
LQQFNAETNEKQEFNGEFLEYLFVSVRVTLFCSMHLGFFLRRNMPVMNEGKLSRSIDKIHAEYFKDKSKDAYRKEVEKIKIETGS